MDVIKNNPLITKDEFEAIILKKWNITKKEYDKKNVSMHCYCGEDICKGWFPVANNKNSIELHLVCSGTPPEE